MKRIFALLTAAILALALAACGSQTTQPASADAEESAVQEQTIMQPAQTEEAVDTTETTQQAEETSSNILVVYFSATGATKGVAEKIAVLTEADTYEIIAVEPYSDADLNWNDRNSRTTKEQNDKSVRPEIASEQVNLDSYDTIYVGYPIWWGEEPRIMDTFAETYDFTGKTVIPFCTSSSSGIGRSGSNLAERAGNGTWLDGKRFGGSVSDADLQAWIDELK